MIFFLSFALFIPLSIEAKTRNQYPGVVQLHSTIKSQGVVIFSSAVFIDSNILITAAHNLYELNEPVEKNLFFKDSKTRSLIPVTKVLHLDLEYDLAVLETGDYQSDTFYSLPEDSHFNLLDEIELVGFSLGGFNSMKAHVLEQRGHLVTSATLHFEALSGASGGAVINPNTKDLIGIVIRDFALPSTAQFVSVARIKNLLSKTPLSCSFTDCFKDQLAVLISEAEKEDTNAQYSLAMLLYNRLDTPLAVQWLARASENGSVLAKYNLGNYAFIGKEMEYDLTKAINLYKEIGHDFVFAAYRLGAIYLTGAKGIPVNHEAGLYWMKVAAEKHFFQAEYHLGMLYYTAKNFDQAIYWIKRAADKGYFRAELQLAIMYHFGEGVEAPDDSLAIRWAEKAAHKGSIEAIRVLRALYDTVLN